MFIVCYKIESNLFGLVASPLVTEQIVRGGGFSSVLIHPSKYAPAVSYIYNNCSDNDPVLWLTIIITIIECRVRSRRRIENHDLQFATTSRVSDAFHFAKIRKYIKRL